MDAQTWGFAAAILVPLGMIALRALTRDRPALAEVEGIAVFEGDEATCRERVELLAEAGVPAWIESGPQGHAVHVDAAQAAEVPELLRRRTQTPIGGDP